LEEEETKFFQEAGKVLTESQKVSLAKEYEAEFLTLRTKEDLESCHSGLDPGSMTPGLRIESAMTAKRQCPPLSSPDGNHVRAR
jgi:hypothetical protein